MNEPAHRQGYEDGVYVEFFPDDTSKQNEPESIVIIRDCRLELHLHPEAREFQFRWFARISSLVHQLQGRPWFENWRIELLLYRMWGGDGGYGHSPQEYHKLKSQRSKYYEGLAYEWLERSFEPFRNDS